jgi:hypothetical protein
MLFYRVENDQKEGPYNPSHGPGLMQHLTSNGILNYADMHGEFSNYMRYHPTPDNDELIHDIWANIRRDKIERDKYIFGFESFDKVFIWFNMEKELEFLKTYKFHISIYEIDYCHHGKWQSIANKENLILVDTLEF